VNDEVTITRDNGDLERCVNGVCDVVKRSNGNGRRKIRTVIGLIAPLLLRATDPRIVALGLALQAGSMAFLGAKRAKQGGH